MRASWSWRTTRTCERPWGGGEVRPSCVFLRNLELLMHENRASFDRGAEDGRGRGQILQRIRSIQLEADEISKSRIFSPIFSSVHRLFYVFLQYFSALQKFGSYQLTLRKLVRVRKTAGPLL
jgi:hypothetical protein